MTHVKRIVRKHAKARKKSFVKCKSCAGPAHRTQDFCYGCKRVICIWCMTKYDHNGDGAKHGVKPKKEK